VGVVTEQAIAVGQRGSSRHRSVIREDVHFDVGCGAVADCPKSYRRTCSERPVRGMLCPMSIESLQQELAALPAHERRRVQAFLVALQDSNDAAYRRKLSEKIDQPAESFASLEELDRRLET